MISYISTRGGGPKNFEEILLSGLAPDGGLYVPGTWPRLDIKALKGKSYNEIAEAVMFPFVEGCIDRAALRKYIDEVYSDENFPGGVAPVKSIYPGLYIMELFHGPTIAFKDVALQLLGRLFDHVLKKRGKKITIVGATSGDTGSAAIEGCRHAQGVEIFILHPKDRVSDVQRRQMTTVDAPNVHNIAIKGTFDDCQNLVKAMFNDAPFRDDMNLSAVNSINWARIMAQIVYYVKASLEVDGACFAVPTGNFGNVYAAYAAKKMGASFRSIAIATNKNDILTRFFETGEMHVKDVFATYSPSMDIQVSSNFERYLFDLLDRDAAKLQALMEEFRTRGFFKLDDDLMKRARQDFTAQRCGEQETILMIKKIYHEMGYIVDPHTAVGVAAAMNLRIETGRPVIALATAHPAKFPAAVQKATGERPMLPERLMDLMEKPENMKILANDLAKVEDYIRRQARP